MDLLAARRQALGPEFRSERFEARRAAELKDGRLALDPHPAWALPERPTWREDPFRDRAWRSRYHSLLWLDPLRRADLEGDDAAAELWWFLARSWTETNPPDDPGVRDAWDGPAVVRRALALACGATVTGQQPWLAEALARHVQRLAEPLRSAPGGGRVNQHAALFVLGTVLEDQPTRDLAVHRLAEQLVLDYDEQGVHRDGAVSYQLQHCLWWHEALIRLDLEGVPRPAGAQRVALAPRFLAHATSPLGRFARIGDTDGGHPGHVDHPLTRFAASGGREGQRPGTGTAIYDAGYGFVRSGWGETAPFGEETYVTVTWGRQDKPHGHRDGGSVTVAAEGVQWIDDTGRYGYDDSPLRRYVLGRSGHNAVVLPGRSYRSATDVSVVAHEDTDDWFDLVLQDPGYQDASITRRIIYLKARRQLLVLDAVEADEDVAVEQQWHCGRGVAARRAGTGFSLQRDGHTHHVTVLHGGHRTEIRRGRTEPVAGWTSTGWQQATPVDQLVVGAHGRTALLAAQIGPREEAFLDLLGPRLTRESLRTPVPELVPAPLLRTGRRRREQHPADAGGLAVTLDVEDSGLLTVDVHGGGPLWAFYLLHPDGSIERSPYSRRPARSLRLKNTAGALLRVYSRADTGAVTTRTIPLSPDPPDERTTS